MKKTHKKYDLLREFWPQIKEQILYRTYVLRNSNFYAKLPLTACGTFIFLKFVCILFLTFHARIQYLKESRVVAIESFSIELKEAMLHKCYKKTVPQNIGGTYKKTRTPKYNFR